MPNTFSNSGRSGALAGIFEESHEVFVPLGYVSGADLGTSTAAWNSQTLSSLGLTPGLYVYTWGTAPHADSLTVQIAVPEPASLSLIALAGPMLLRRRRIA